MNVCRRTLTHFDQFFFSTDLPVPHMTGNQPGVLGDEPRRMKGTAQATFISHLCRIIHRVPRGGQLPQTRPGGSPPTLAVGPTSSDVSGYHSDIHQQGLSSHVQSRTPIRVTPSNIP